MRKLKKIKPGASLKKKELPEKGGGEPQRNGAWIEQEIEKTQMTEREGGTVVEKGYHTETSCQEGVCRRDGHRGGKNG